MTVTIEFEDGTEKEFDGTRFEDGFVIGQEKIERDFEPRNPDSRLSRIGAFLDELMFTMLGNHYEVEETGYPEHRVQEIK